MAITFMISLLLVSICFTAIQSNEIESSNKIGSESGASIVRIPDENGGKDWILEVKGDMITMSYRDGERPVVTRALAKAKKPWPGGKVPYFIDKRYTSEQRQIIEKGLKHLSEQTNNCVQFVPYSNQKAYVRIVPGKGCSADAGYQDKQPQYMVLNQDGCMRQQTVIHEATHTLGFDHTQTRQDRDKYLQIVFDNIKPEEQYNFKKQDTNNELVGFDFKSVMIYDPINTFAIDQKKPTMIPKSRSNRLLSDKERPDLSKLDIEMIKKFYKCQ